MNVDTMVQLVGGSLDGEEILVDLGMYCGELEFPRLPNTKDQDWLEYDLYVRLGDADIFVWKGIR